MRSYGVKACRVRDLDDARTQLTKLIGDGHCVVVQEYVAGPGSNHYLIDGFMRCRRHGARTVRAPTP